MGNMPLNRTSREDMQMMKMKLTATVSALAIAFAGAAFAQTDLTGSTTINDQIDDMATDANKELARGQDASRFGNPEFRPGLSGSASLGYTGQTGNSESQEFNMGARIRYAQGNFVQTIGLALSFADTAGVSTKEDAFMVYDANYYFNDKVYGFVLGRLSSDGILGTRDGFLGFGPGYRVINTEQVTWRVQAGIGINYAEDALGDSLTETGYIASSRLFYAFNENMFMSNDTDVLKTDSALRINNDLGVNFKMSNALSTRVSYLTEYDDSQAIRSDNKLGVSIVYGF